MAFVFATQQIENGVGSMIMGPYGDSGEVAVVVGGNCFIQCFNLEGDELFWNVMSDQVTALAFVDFDDDGHNQVEILLSSDQICENYINHCFRECFLCSVDSRHGRWQPALLQKRTHDDGNQRNGCHYIFDCLLGPVLRLRFS